jgi:hypothetical protein
MVETEDADGYFDTSSGSTYALGGVVITASHNFKNSNTSAADSDFKDTATRNNYVWRDGAVLASINYDNLISMVGSGGTNYIAATNSFLVTNLVTRYSTTFTLNSRWPDELGCRQ